MVSKSLATSTSDPVLRARLSTWSQSGQKVGRQPRDKMWLCRCELASSIASPWTPGGRRLCQEWVHAPPSGAGMRSTDVMGVGWGLDGDRIHWNGACDSHVKLDEKEKDDVNRVDEGYGIFFLSYYVGIWPFSLLLFSFFCFFFGGPRQYLECLFPMLEALAEGLLLCGSWLRNSACGMYFARWSCHLPPAVIPVTFGHNTTACQRPC